MNLPQARTTDILEQEAGSDLLIYDLRINKAFNLNETSKIVYRACDGQTSFDELKLKYQFTDDLIYLTLNELKANGLIESDMTNHFAGLSRREVVKRVGLTCAVALPVIAGIVAPQAMSAASGACQVTGACIRSGNNICAGCAGRTLNYAIYVNSTDGTCSGASAANSITCGSGISTAGRDVKITTVS